MNKISFTEEEQIYIMKYFKQKTHKELAEELDCSVSAITKFCRENKLYKNKEGLKLTIELVPYHSFQNNLRYILSKEDWDKVRKDTYKRYNYQCSICRVSNVVLSAHEEWIYEKINYKKKKGIQRLNNIVCLCNNCHMIKHIAFADELARQGKLDMRKLVNHFLEVNECDELRLALHYQESVEKWNQLSNIEFTLDIDFLKTLDLDLDYYK